MISLIQNQAALNGLNSQCVFYLRRRRGRKINNFPGPWH